MYSATQTSRKFQRRSGAGCAGHPSAGGVAAVNDSTRTVSVGLGGRVAVFIARQRRARSAPCCRCALAPGVAKPHHVPSARFVPIRLPAMRVLITDGTERAALAAARSLVAPGHDVTVAAPRPLPL